MNKEINGTFCMEKLFIAPPPISYDKVEIMQFTGILDKNGKEIYEGDIVSFGKDYFDVDMLGKVYWYDKTAGFFIHRFDAEGQIEEEVLISDYDIEVIGNIYENPELLESEKWLNKFG